MHIRAARSDESELLHAIWLRSVRATHDFVAADDLQSFIPLVRTYLTTATDLDVLCDGDTVIGFMGMTGSQIDILFLEPDHLRRGGGRLLIDHARARHGELTVDCNEQNVAACRFYAACGFVVEGRSPLDTTGRPYPLVHMRWRQ
ncbi:MAG: GNAT family N-acetyltransferase [Planctomycetota bacterium]